MIGHDVDPADTFDAEILPAGTDRVVTVSELCVWCLIPIEQMNVSDVHLAEQSWFHPEFVDDLYDGTLCADGEHDAEPDWF